MTGMENHTKRLLESWQIRKSRKQKKAFRSWLCGELEALGYNPTVEGFYNRNVVAGEPDTAKLLLTAHYDTCAVLPIPNFITPRNLLFYLAYQLLITALIFALALGTQAVLGLFCEGWLPHVVCVAIIWGCCWWIMDGPANRNTANDNTSGVATLLEIARDLPEDRRGAVCFVFFDNEEKGMLGSQGFAMRHKAARKEALVLNFDCVSDGDYIQFYPERRLKKKNEWLTLLEDAFPASETKTVEVVRGFGFYPSDNKSFRYGAGVCALKKKPVIGYYMDRIHTAKDTVLDEENLRFLKDVVLRLTDRLNG